LARPHENLIAIGKNNVSIHIFCLIALEWELEKLPSERVKNHKSIMAKNLNKDSLQTLCILVILKKNCEFS
jgi:hypothetical protein